MDENDLLTMYPELETHMDEPWFIVGFLLVKLIQSEEERELWKSRAMSLRIKQYNKESISEEK